MGVILFVVLVLLIGAVLDVRFHRIPNWLTFSALAAGLAYHLIASGLHGLYFSAGGLILGFALLLPFYLMGGMGAGDVKLLAAVGALLGPTGVFWAFLCTALVGGIYAMALLVASRSGKEACAQYKESVRTFLWTRNIAEFRSVKMKKAPVLCYGVAIALGTFLSLLKTTYLR